ncbi:MAG: histidine phosphatase family protein [Sphingobacteriaceae bacterium]|nr:histidine phosphatase family protein [Sphingobacteriaceae bacterium]
MKELILVRHAKSEWGTDNLKDIDRPLNARGYADAYRMSKWFKMEKLPPDLIVASYATRTLSTAFIFAREFEYASEKLSITESFYEAKAQKILSFIGKLNKDIERPMLFMHNPGITELVNSLNEDVFMDNVPTCGIVSIQFSIKNWSDINNAKGQLNYFHFPKDFKENA